MAVGLVAGLGTLAVAQDPAPTPAPAGRQRNVIEVVRAPAGNTFEALWSAYQHAAERSDTQARDKAWAEIRHMRVERNIPGVDSIALALVDLGLGHLAGGKRELAEQEFASAVEIDPRLPDAHLALALASMKKGPSGSVAALQSTVRGFLASFATTRGAFHLATLGTASVLLALFGAVSVIALALVFRHGSLLLHDVEEALAGKPRSLSLGVYVFLLLLPAAAFQGYGWLPLWWLALLFVYMSLAERCVAGALLVSCLAVGPLVTGIEDRMRTERNSLYRAAIQTIEIGPDVRATSVLEAGAKKFPDDRDLTYLLALQYRKAGRYDDAASLYRELLKAAPKDPVALNNLANIAFTQGEFAQAIARYKQGIESAPGSEIEATFQYNKQLAHLQLFEYQPAQEARANADRLAAGLIRGYDSVWKDDKNLAAVDLAMSAELANAKFNAAAPDSNGIPNVTGGKPESLAAPISAVGAMLNRFSGFLLVAAAVYFLLQRFRGSKMFTMRCLKCGTPFCKKCHLGAAAAGLCTQCHHLFVVKDGVSGPARNQKMLEVQKEEERRDRIFRVLSLVFPGAGHLYARKTVAGAIYVLLWFMVLASALLAGNVLPVTEAPALLAKPWGLGLAAVTLLVLYVVVNRARPDFAVALPPPRAAVRRRTT